MMTNETKLFTPCKIGGLELANRMIVTAIHTGFPAGQETAFLVKRAEGGAAAVTATMGVSAGGAQHNMCVLNDDILPDLKKMADSVHRAGGKLFIQLFHAGRNSSTGRLADPLAKPVAPSPVPSPIYKETPEELTADGIRAIVEDFGNAARICREAGADAVEISCSAGYLLSEFLSVLTNRRQDNYGGAPENRLRFPLEVIRKVRESAGKDYPVLLRVSGSDMIGGYGLDLTVRLVSEAEEYIDAVNVTGGWHESRIPQISMHVPEGGFAFLAREVKRAVKIPVIACNRINSPEVAEEVLNSGCSDFVGCCRAFLVDGDFGNKIREGKKYRKCIACNNCIEQVLKGEQVSCTFNPSVGKEGLIRARISEKGKKVLVAGGGAAGMEAALQYAKAGCRVRLCSEEGELGGLMKFAAKIPHKAAIGGNIAAMEEELADAGVEIARSTRVDEKYIAAYRPDLVIVAAGSRPLIPPVPGIDRGHVYTAQEILSGEGYSIYDLIAGKILIIGGGAVGLETALYLAGKAKLDSQSRQFLSLYTDNDTAEGLDFKSNITVVEMDDKLGKDLKSTRWITLNELKRSNVQLISGTKVEEILPNEVVAGSGDGMRRIAADYVILAAGYRPAGRRLIQWLEKNGYEYRIAGDAKKIGTISDAVTDAFSLI